MTDRDRIVRKIRKLLELDATNATQGEVENAVALASRMMQEHAVEQADLEDAGGEARTMGKGESPLRGKVSTWEAWLCTAVKRAVPGVSCYTTRRTVASFNGSGRRAKAAIVVWFGPEDLVEVARRLYDETRHVIATMAAGKYGTVYQGEGRSYCEGFASALAAKVKTTQAETGLAIRTNAIVLKADRTNKAWLAKTEGIRLSTTSRGGGGRHHGSAYGEGNRDGSRHGFAAGTARTGRSFSGGQWALPGA